MNEEKVKIIKKILTAKRLQSQMAEIQEEIEKITSEIEVMARATGKEEIKFSYKGIRFIVKVARSNRTTIDYESFYEDLKIYDEEIADELFTITNKVVVKGDKDRIELEALDDKKVGRILVANSKTSIGEPKLKIKEF